MNNTRWLVARMQYGKNTSISCVITRATQIANSARRYFALTALAAALSACNQNDDDPTAQPDSAKPVIVVANPSLINGLILEATQPQSLIISPAGRINATDNSGKVNLTVWDVVGLSKSQIVLRPDGQLVANNISSATPIGRGSVVVRATDTSGNFTDSTVYFDISPSLSSTQVTITPTQSHTFKFAVMPNITSASVTVPTNVMGVSGQAYLAGNEVVITLNTNSSTVAGEFKPQVSLMTAEGKAYPLVLTVMVKVDAPTTYAEPVLDINQDTNTVSINNMGDLVKDFDGVKDVTVYLEANGVRIGNSEGIYANVLTSTSADVAYTISADYLTKNNITGKYEPGTHKFTTKAVLDKEVPADPAPTIVPGSAFANLGDMTVSDMGGFDPITIMTWSQPYAQQYIDLSGVIDSLGRPVALNVTWLPPWVTFDATTERISGTYNSRFWSTWWWFIENFNVTITAQPQGSSQFITKTFILGVWNDG